MKITIDVPDQYLEKMRKQRISFRRILDKAIRVCEDCEIKDPIFEEETNNTQNQLEEWRATADALFVAVFVELARQQVEARAETLFKDPAMWQPNPTLGE